MSERLATNNEIAGLLRRLGALEKRIGLVEVIEKPLYATGSFVPTLVGAGTAGTFTYVANVNLVEWTRIGNRLFFNGRVQISAIAVAPIGAMSIAGFPYAGVADANMAIAGGAAVFFWQANVAAGYTQVGGQVANGGTAMTLIKDGDNIAAVAVDGAEIIATSQFRFIGSYRVA